MSVRRAVQQCAVLFFFAVSAYTQVAPRQLITRSVDETQLITLRGNTHPLAQPQFDAGTAAPDQPLHRMLLVLKRSPEQEFALRKLLDDQQDKASPNYHKWLTPDEFGTKFGPADQDVQTVTAWLQSHGFEVNRVTHGKTIMEFSGVESQVEAALHTQIHKYLVNGEEHWANAYDPQIPAALAPVVAGVQALNNFRASTFSHLGGVISRNKDTGKLTPLNSRTPLFTLGGECGVQSSCYGIGPYDFATIYDELPAWNATPAIDGTGETLAIVGETDINPQDVTDFRNFFGLPAYGQSGGPTLNVIHDGVPPGILTNGEESEADLDVEWSGAVAKGASVDFVVSQTTEVTLGVNLSALYIVDHNLAPVMSESYGICELFLGPSGNQFFSALWQQAAAQGITAMLAAGDGSSAGCDNFDAAGPATHGLQVSGFASTPYNVAVGGTDLNDLTDASTYWNSTNNSTTQASALGYIPETTWDSNCTNPVFGDLLGYSKNAEANCNNQTLISYGFVNIVGGSGGKSGCLNSDGQDPATCSGGYSKPSWQNASGVPGDGVRDLPDVSLFAATDSPSGSFLILCEADLIEDATSCNPSDPNTEFLAIGGTSASSPSFAGVMALVNQQMQARQGNANYVLYQLAKHAPTALHDVTAGTNEVPCATSSPNCTTSVSGDQYGILNGYNTGAGYDLATGLGSVDVNNLVQNWNLAKFTATTTTFNLSPTSVTTHGQSVNVTGTVAPTSGSGTPTGVLTLLTSTGLSIDGFKLSGGSVSGSTKQLPGGSYTVSAHYSGDPTFASSDSQPVSVTVGKENSAVALQLITFDWNNNLLSNNATGAVYGSPYILRVNVLNSQNAACQPNPLGEIGCPTGNVTLTDNGSALDGGTFALNSEGYTEDQTIQLSGGSNAVKASYSGDNSYDSSNISSTYSITPAPTTIGTPSVCCGAVGQSFTTSVVVQAQSTGAAPTGTVEFLSNGNRLGGTVSYQSAAASPTNPIATLTASFTSSSSAFTSPGTYAITASYSGDSNYQSSTSSASSVTVKYPAPNLSFAQNSQTVPSGTSVTITAVVDTLLKGVPAPTGTVSFSDWFTGLAIPGSVTYSTAQDTNGNVVTQASITFTPAGDVTVAAEYSGDSNYPAVDWVVGSTVNVTGTDFALAASPPSLTVYQGEQAVEFIFVQEQQGFAGSVSFSASSCAGLPNESTCSLTSTSVSGGGVEEITITTTAPHAVAGSRRQARQYTDPTMFLGLGMPLVGFVLMGARSRRKRRLLVPSLLALLLLISGGCGGGGGSSGGGGGGGNIDPGTPLGNFTITVTGTSGSTSHTATFTLLVQ